MRRTPKKVVEYSKRADHVNMLHDYDYIEKRLQIIVLFLHSVVGIFELWTQYPGSVCFFNVGPTLWVF